MIGYKVAANSEMLAQKFNSLGKEVTTSFQVTNVTRSPSEKQAKYTQQYQHQAFTQAQQQPVNPQAAYPQATKGGRWFANSTVKCCSLSVLKK
jgi:hypothetical protein